MGFWYTILSGDTLESIAEMYELDDWREIYNAPENDEFRQDRPNPKWIEAGDEVYVPADEEDMPDEAMEEDVEGSEHDEEHDPWSVSREGEEGFSEDQDVDEDEEDEQDDPEPDSDEPMDLAEDDADATAVHPVCRNLSNTIDIRPGGFHWFSA